MVEAPAPRPLPANLEVEQALLGAILVNNDAFGAVSGFLQGRHFREPVHQEIFDRMAQMLRAGTVVTPATLMTYLPAEVARPEGFPPIAQYVARLAAEATSVVAAPDYGRQVQELAIRRELIATAEDMRELAYDRTVAVPNQVAETEQRLFDLTRELSRGAGQGAMTAASAAEDVILAMEDPDARPWVVSTGLKALDKIIGGFQAGNLGIIAGRPGMMKTTLASALALNVASAGIAVSFHSKEMPANQLAARMISDMAYQTNESLTYEGILSGRLNERNRLLARDGARKLKGLPLYIDPQTGLTVAEIAIRTRRRADMFAKRGVRLGLVVIDHLGKVRAEGRGRDASRHLELGDMTNALADLSKELKIAILVLSQLNRDVDKRDNKRPALTDLRESGRIEEDADLVLGLYREAYYLGRTRENEPSKEAKRLERLASTINDLEVLVLKNRNGSEGVAKLWASAPAGAIRDWN